jgi:hypothetical protein
MPARTGMTLLVRCGEACFDHILTARRAVAFLSIYKQDELKKRYRRTLR